MTFAFNSCFDKFYRYRTAIVQASIWITLDDEEKEYLRHYIKKMGHNFDNHICWSTKDGMYYMYSDGQLGIGNDISVEKW